MYVAFGLSWVLRRSLKCPRAQQSFALPDRDLQILENSHRKAPPLLQDAGATLSDVCGSLKGLGV